MKNGKYVAYYRVSTDKQGKSGLGLDAQREIVTKYLNGGNWSLLQEFVEVESGKRTDRTQLDAALKLCRKHGATLIVAKLDRLARDTRFLLKVVHDSGEAGVVFCDLPTIPEGPVGKFLITQMASVAELEAGLISQRTKVALAASKARGTKLGGLRSSSERIAEIAAAGRKAQSAEAAKGRAALLPVIADIRSTMPNASLRQIAAELDARGETTPRGGAWSAVQVLRVLERTTKAA